MLQARRIGAVPLENYELAAEIAWIDSLPVDDTYDAFTFGQWSSHVLANGSGCDDDTVFRPHGEGLQLTSLGRQCPRVFALICDHFVTTRLRWVRVFKQRNGVLAPHIDFLEFKSSGTRAQVPLRTSREALHSENDQVYHMRRGEVWVIHTANPHSARTGCGPARLSLCLDFDAGLEDVFGPRHVDRGMHEQVLLVRRPPLEDQVAHLLETGDGMTLGNMRARFREFASVHFDRQANAADAFKWFIQAADRSPDPSVAAKARAFKAYCLERRGYRENFAW
jgi:putative nonproteinogenic amino acid hydroxylase